MKCPKPFAKPLTWVVPALATTLLILSTGPALAADGEILKRVLTGRNAGPNLVKPDAWRPYQAGFKQDGAMLVCDNGTNHNAQRGAVQQFDLNQKVPCPIVASAWCKAEDVDGARDSDFSVYLDLVYMDGTPLWGQIASFSVGTHGDERREVTVLPDKPVKSVSFNLLLRNHAGRAAFHDPELHTIEAPTGSTLFDSVPVVREGNAAQGFQIRDVAAGSDFVTIGREALGIRLDCKTNAGAAGTFIDLTATSLSTNDRAITLIYSIPATGSDWRWLDSLRNGSSSPGVEHMFTTRQPAGMGRLSRMPFGAITDGKSGMGLGIDMSQPALFRIGFNSDTHELFLAYDLGFTAERPEARVRFVAFTFDPAWQMRSALARYYELFPTAFQQRIGHHGLWMPFARISAVPHFEDFGFRFKEGNDETAWDDAHDMLTFRYTEPMTWWMSMATNLPRTVDAALAEAKRLADAKHADARAFLTSAHYDENGKPAARLLDTPWCNGAVWSINSAPSIRGEVTDFKNKWNLQLRQQLYGPNRKGDLDGEYIDSAEGYVTEVLDFRRDHFAAMETPLTFSPDSHKPAIYRGLITFEYVRGIEREVHGMGKFMMANSTPDHLCWLAPLLDVLGTETDWNPGAQWKPMPDSELLYRRALCKGKPYCLLMNTRFDQLPTARVENYMQRCVAYGMMPGFFSADASTGHYFSRPELFERDRPTFKKYIPLIRQLSEMGWQPVTLAKSSNNRVYVERFGEKFLTVYNDSAEPQTTTITLEFPARSSQELLSGETTEWTNQTHALTLAPAAVAVLKFQ